MSDVIAPAVSDFDGDLRPVARATEPLPRRGEVAGRQSAHVQQPQLQFARWGAATLMAGVVIVAAGAPAINYFVPHYNSPLEAGAAVIAVVTFLGVWLLQRHVGAGRYDRNSMRDGIAAAFVVTYLVIVSWAAFMRGEQAVTPLAQAVIPNFTVLVGVVVGGYFGADAVKQVSLINARRREQGSDVGSD